MIQITEPQFKVRYPIHLFKFIDDLSQWSEKGTSKEVREEHRDSLTGRQEKLLEEYTKIRKKNRWGSRFHIEFCRSDTLEEALDKTRKTLPRDHEKLEEIYREFNNTFKTIYKEKKPLLKKLELQKTWEDLDKDPLKKISQTLDLEWPTEEIEVFLCCREQPPEQTTATSFPRKGFVSICFSEETLKSSKEDITALVLHELIHYLLRGPYNPKNIIKILYEDYGLNEEEAKTIEETICNSLAPEGLLSHEILETPIKTEASSIKEKKNLHWGEQDFKRRNILPVMKEYYQKKKEEDFWEECLPRIVKKVAPRKELPLSTLKTTGRWKNGTR